MAHRDDAADFSSRVDAPHWEGLGRKELLIQRCTACSTWFNPPDWRCWQCGSFDLGWEATEPHGVIYSWIRSHYPFVPAYADLIPYVNVLVELPAAGNVRLLGMLVGNEDGLRIGAPVTGVFEPASDRTEGFAVLRWEIDVRGKVGS